MTKVSVKTLDNERIIAFTPDGNMEQVEDLNKVYPANTYFFVPRHLTYLKPKLYISNTWFKTTVISNTFWYANYVPSDSLPERIQAWKLLMDTK